MPISRFTSSGHTDLEKDADLAIFLIDYLDSCRDSATGAWPGERETRRLQNTCHVVEAISELGLGQFSARRVDPGVKWLTELPLLRQVLPQDRYAVRVYPVRFKTLAALNRFDANRLRADFDDLCKHADSKSGWLLDVPGEFKSMVASMIWLDALLYLREAKSNEFRWLAYLDPGLDAIEAVLRKWLDAGGPNLPGPGRPLELTGGNASYAIEILIRAGRLVPISTEGERAMAALIKTIYRRDRHDPGKRALYSALNLSRSFAYQPEARAAVADLLRDVRARYEAGAQSDHPDYFHAIALRLLAAFYKNALRETIFEALWLRNRQAAAREQDDVEQQQRAALTALIHQHVHIHLGQVTRLSGTRTRAAVYRVQFSLQSEATDRDGHPFAIVPNSLQLVIKQGSIESLSRTIRRYNELPDDLRRYFARHSDQAETSGDDWYLIMEDLVGMSPLSEVLDRVDLRWAGRAEHDQLTRVAAAIAQALRALHQHRRRAPVASNEIGWLYLNPISESINAACESNAFPELKGYVENGFEANGVPFHRLNDYLAQLHHSAPALTPPALSAVHGDCHSRNLLVDEVRSAVKFVDLETLSYTDDYLTDYGVLLEDVALYRYLPRGQRPDALTVAEIVADSTHLDYPLLPRSADSVLFFEQCLLDQIALFALSVGDPDFKPRLWLAIARNLIQLVARQLPVTDPHRRNEALKLSLVAYAESIRLLHELTQSLAHASPLPALPFTGLMRVS